MIPIANVLLGYLRVTSGVGFSLVVRALLHAASAGELFVSILLLDRRHLGVVEAFALVCPLLRVSLLFLFSSRHAIPHTGCQRKQSLLMGRTRRQYTSQTFLRKPTNFRQGATNAQTHRERAHRNTHKQTYHTGRATTPQQQINQV